MTLASTVVRPDRVAIYIRWSTEDQGEGTTLQVQREGCEHYILSQGWRVNPELIFVDDGYSGGSLHRPAMARLREAVRLGTVDCVVVFKLDRLSRSVLDTVRLVLEEWDGRCCLRSAREAVDTASPSGKMLFYMLVSYAEWERGTIRERTLMGKLKRAEAGRNPGFTPPFGYASAARGDFTLVPEEATVVRLAYSFCLMGLSCAAAAARLSAAGHRTRAGMPWTAAAVRRLLTNPAYAGELQYGRRPRTAGGRRRPLGAPTIVCPGALPAIVDPPASWAAAALLAARRGAGGRSTGGHTHLLSGFARCACGAPLRAFGRGNGAIYACGARGRRQTTSEEHTPALPAAELDAAFLTAFWRQFGQALAPATADGSYRLAWRRLGPEQRKAVLRLLVAAVTLAPQPEGSACVITWHCGPQQAGASPA